MASRLGSSCAVPRSDVIVLSIRPGFVDRILAGVKTVELRRKFPRRQQRATILLYSTAPVQAIVARAVLEEVCHLALANLWQRFSHAAAVTRDEFEGYFLGVETGCALRLSNVCPLSKPLHLKDLMRRFDFSPPQSFCYWQGAPVPAAHGRTEIPTRR